MKKILILMLIICPHLLWGQTISLQEYNDRCTRNDEIIKDVSTIEELRNYFRNEMGEGEEVLVVTDELNRIATYKTIPAPNKVRLYGYVFEYDGIKIMHKTIDYIGEARKFIIILRDNAYPNDVIVEENKYGSIYKVDKYRTFYNGTVGCFFLYWDIR